MSELVDLVHRRAWPPGDGSLHAALARRILERERLDPGLRVANVGGWHSEPQLQTWDGDDVATLLERIRQHALAIGALGLRIEAWANVMRRGAHQLAHRHGQSLWSGVYYVDAGDGAGGAITFARGEASLVIEPAAGMLLLFPGDLLHSVARYAGEAPRISVGFNLFR